MLKSELGDLSEWHFSGKIAYHPAESLDDWFCVCGVRILYAHQIVHVSGNSATVGSECVHHFIGGRDKGIDDKRHAAIKIWRKEHCVLCDGTGEWHDSEAGYTKDCPGCVAYSDTERGKMRLELARGKVQVG